MLAERSRFCFNRYHKEMLSTNYIHRFISSLTFTVAIETLAIFLLLWFVFKKRESGWKNIVLAGIFASFATIPYVWFVFPYITKWSYSTSLAYSEPFAFLIEALLYRIFLKIDIRIALVVSLVANGLSYFLGPILRNHGLWIYW